MMLYIIGFLITTNILSIILAHFFITEKEKEVGHGLLINLLIMGGVLGLIMAIAKTDYKTRPIIYLIILLAVIAMEIRGYQQMAGFIGGGF